MPGRIQWLTEQAVSQNITAHLSDAMTSTLQQIYTQIQRNQGLVPYTTNGAESATSTAFKLNNDIVTGKTKDGMHSEMVVIQKMLADPQNGWIVNDGKIVYPPNQVVQAANFFTDLPHCGYCTITLAILGLPLGMPTCGNYNYANNYNYALPPQLKYNPQVFLRYIFANGYTPQNLMTVVSCFVNNSKDWQFTINGQAVNNPPQPAFIVEWNDVVQTKSNLLNIVLAQIWQALYNVNNNLALNISHISSL